MKHGGFFVLGVALAAACTGTDPIVPNGNGNAADGGLLPAASGALVLGDVALSAAPSRKITAHLSVERNGVTGAIDVSSPDTPAGVGVEPLQIPDGASEGDLVVNATFDVTQTRTKVTLEARVAGTLNATRPVELVVRGLAGSLDRTNATSGTFPSPLTGHKPAHLAADDQGRIFAISEDCKLSRHLPTGPIDPTFSAPDLTPSSALFAGGRITPSCGPIAARGATLAVSGSAANGVLEVASQAMLFRLDLDGKLQPSPLYLSFGRKGSSLEEQAEVGAVALDDNGDARLAVDTTEGTAHEIQVVGVDGKLAQPLTASLVVDGQQSNWTILPDGRARFLSETMTTHVFDVGFLKDGNLDPQIGGTGMSESPGRDRTLLAGAGSQRVWSATVDSQGHAFAAGWFGSGDSVIRRAFISRHSLDDAWVDPIAGTTRNITKASNGYSAIAVDPATNMIVTAGIDESGLFVARFDASGQPDVSFGTAGVAHFASDIAATDVEAFGALLLQSDGGVISVTNDDGGVNLVRFWL